MASALARMRRWWHARQWAPRISALVDDGLPLPERVEVERHIRGCEPCADRFAAYMQLERLGREYLQERSGGSRGS